MRELNVNELQEVGGGPLPAAVWFGGYVVRYAIGKLVKKSAAAVAIGAAGVAGKEIGESLAEE